MATVSGAILKKVKVVAALLIHETQHAFSHNSALGHGLQLETPYRCDSDFCSNRISVALVSYEFQDQPMVRCHRHIVQNIQRFVIGGHNRVQPSVIIHISNRHSAPHPGLAKHAARICGYVEEAMASILRQQHRFAVAKIRGCQFYRV